MAPYRDPWLDGSPELQDLLGRPLLLMTQHTMLVKRLYAIAGGKLPTSALRTKAYFNA